MTQHSTTDFGAHHTKLRRPLTLKYSEALPTLVEARRREKEIKGWRREKKERLFK
jgi:predicted GIY-YIG superfamily endonuclease